MEKRLLYLARALWQKFFFLPASEGLTLFGFGSRERRRIHLDLNSRLESPLLFRLMTAHLMNSTKLKEKKKKQLTENPLFLDPAKHQPVSAPAVQAQSVGQRVEVGAKVYRIEHENDRIVESCPVLVLPQRGAFVTSK